jgi:uncharacterized protein (DUF885 family)
MRNKTLVVTLCFCLISNLVYAADTDSAERRAQHLNALIAEQWQYTMEQSPEWATSVGDYRYNNRWSDMSLAHVRADRRATESFLRRFLAINITGLSEQDQLNHQLMVQQLRESIEATDLKLYEMPVDQFTGIQIGLPGAVPTMPFDSVKHYEDYIARLNGIPKLLQQVTGVLRQGRADKMMPPRFLLDKVVEQTKAIAAPAGLNNAFGQPALQFADSIPDSDRQRLKAQIITAVDSRVRPAYEAFARYLQKDYAPFGRQDAGIWSLPNGERLYEFLVRRQTTTNMKPEDIHTLGMREVARIEEEMTAIAHTLGFSTLEALRASVSANASQHAASREQILQLYRDYIADMQPKLPTLFGLLPKTPVEVHPVQAYREKGAAGAEYSPGTPDGSRPGMVFVNTGDFAQRELITVESTAYHEAVPGHHMQISIAQGLGDLPPFRQNAGYTAYVEGWALYSERLGKDIGFFRDPYSDYGRLVSELLRADRLVLDTGVHFKHWTREQMIDFFHAHAAGDEPTFQAETDRYIAAPGQALCYKLGQLKFLALRDRAKQVLGDHFDIRAFHDQMLKGGALPLSILDSQFETWLTQAAH